MHPCLTSGRGRRFLVDELPSEKFFAGSLLGTAVGDALGLPAENLSPQRIQKLWAGEWRMRFLFGRDMISDDTEHTLMVAQALLSEPDDPARFQHVLARKLKWWFAALPGGVGLATARACLRIWVGFRPENCGVRSAGSGPAMRSAIIGVYFADAPDKRRAFTLASSRLTHRGWQAETAALAVAEAAAPAVNSPRGIEPFQLLQTLRNLSPEQEWQLWIRRMEGALAAGATVAELAGTAGLAKGVSGYALHVVPIALYSAIRHPGDFKEAMTAALNCGGDTDTVGAILGGITGAHTGIEQIPDQWLTRLVDWARSKKFMLRLAQRLALQKTGGQPLGPVTAFWPAFLPRNLLFLTTVILHGLRRLLPR